jgi:hypothetical protein
MVLDGRLPDGLWGDGFGRPGVGRGDQRGHGYQGRAESSDVACGETTSARDSVSGHGNRPRSDGERQWRINCV